MFGVIIPLCRWERRDRSWLAADVHLFNRNKERVTLTYRFTFHSSTVFRCQFASIVFPAATKKSCWHAACLRGVIHHFRRKEAHDEYIQKDLFTCVHYFNFNFSCSQPPDISVQLQLPSHNPTSQKLQGKKKKIISNEVHVSQWFHIQPAKSILSLRRLKIKRNDLLMLLIKQLR